MDALAIAWGFNPEGGGANFSFETRRAHSRLFEYLHERCFPGAGRHFLRAESFFNVASQIERLDEEPGPAPPITPAYGGVSIHRQSHGESFLALLQNRLRGNGIYMFDAPEAALSPSRQLVALARIHELVQKNSQFIIATHSPIIMSYPAATTFLIEDSSIRSVEYEETEYYQITRPFLNHSRSILKELLREGDA